MLTRIVNADQILASADVLDVVRQFVPDLRQRSGHWVAKCPFHQGKGESFQVNPQRGTWTCWSACRSSGQTWTGDAMAFVCRRNGLDRRTDFREALEILAELTGVRPQYEQHAGRGPAKPMGPSRADLFNAVAKAHEHYRLNLLSASRLNRLSDSRLDSAAPQEKKTTSHQTPLDYLHGRGFSDDLIEAWELGYASGDSVQHCGAPIEHLVAAGILAKRKGSGTLYDPLATRVLIPLRNPSGRVVGFAGRSQSPSGSKSAKAKYINTRETPLFRKRELLFGHARALPMRGPVFVMEGQLKVIAAQSAGVRAVAVGGSGLDPAQAALVHRLSDTVCLAYDQDQAGMHATMRSADLLRAAHMDVRVATLAIPDGLPPAGDKIDPDDLLAVGAEISYTHEGYLEWLSQSPFGSEEHSATAKARAINEIILPAIAKQPNPMLRVEELREVSRLTGVALATLQGAMPPAACPPPPPEGPPMPADSRMTPGRLLASACAQAPTAWPGTDEPDALWWAELIDWLHLPLALVDALRSIAHVRRWTELHGGAPGPALAAVGGQWAAPIGAWLEVEHAAAIDDNYILTLQRAAIAHMEEEEALRVADGVASGDLPIERLDVSIAFRLPEPSTGKESLP